MKSYIFWLLAIVAYLPIQSQNALKGTVTNIDTHEVLPFANIYFPNLEKGGITNENGEFTIYDLPNGSHKMIVSIIGYETYDASITLPVKDNLKIALFPSAIEMEEVILSTPFHKLQRDNVMKVEQKNISDLKSTGAVTLSQGINTISGVETISTGVGIGKPVIRGLSSNRVLVYAQGVRLENQQYGDEHGLGLSDAGVSKLIKMAYKLLNLETYFTAGVKEVRAWTIPIGSTAPQAAGVIHTDFEKGFIRAEVIKYNDYVALGSEAKVKEAGKLSVEGKEYIVQDGDMMNFRFNV